MDREALGKRREEEKERKSEREEGREESTSRVAAELGKKSGVEQEDSKRPWAEPNPFNPSA
ncbi:MAG: hypothetical protein JRN06_11535 [Nitrososphaerota archaeon]|nr:hypothetical protein [Nitrososphaerota archaeon]